MGTGFLLDDENVLELIVEVVYSLVNILKSLKYIHVKCTLCILGLLAADN